jgi:hypothetical protein
VISVVANRTRSVQIGVRVSQEELDKLGQAASKEGKSVSAYLREHGLTAAEYQELVERMHA